LPSCGWTPFRVQRRTHATRSKLCHALVLLHEPSKRGWQATAVTAQLQTRYMSCYANNVARTGDADRVVIFEL
jgi:hypothetical protein